MSLVHTAGQQQFGTRVLPVTSLGDRRYGEKRRAELGGVPLYEMRNLMVGLNGDLPVRINKLRVCKLRVGTLGVDKLWIGKLLICKLRIGELRIGKLWMRQVRICRLRRSEQRIGKLWRSKRRIGKL